MFLIQNPGLADFEQKARKTSKSKKKFLSTGSPWGVCTSRFCAVAEKSGRAEQKAARSAKNKIYS